VGPRLRRKRLAGQHAERRDDVFLEVFVLVVAPQHEEVRPEVVEKSPHLAEVRHQEFPMLHGGAKPLVTPVLPPHGLGPSGRLSVSFGQRRICERALQDAGHALVAAAERREVRHAETQDLSHGCLLTG